MRLLKKRKKIFNNYTKMKTLKFIAASLIVALAVSCTSNGGNKAAIDGADSTKTVKPVDPKSLKPSRSEVDSVSYLMGINFGYFIKGYNFGDELNYKLMRKGIEDFINAKGKPRDSAYAKQFKIDPELLNDVFNEFLSKRRAYVAATNKQKETEFLAKNAKAEGVQVTESGLQYIITEPGNDVKPAAADTVFVHYKGTLTDGTVFDESPKNDEGVRMLLNRVIKGWTEGLQLIGEGGKIKLFVPSELGYGENGQSRIEPNSTLIFDIELVKVNKVAATEEEEAK